MRLACKVPDAADLPTAELSLVANREIAEAARAVLRFLAYDRLTAAMQKR
jgi:hypothetical protein